MAVFNGQKAWFSSSVNPKFTRLWERNGGDITEESLCEFLFSQDAGSADTVRLYESEAYLNEHITIFHPNYIRDCVKEGDKKKVILGRYYLPPAELQEKIKKQMKLLYEQCYDSDIDDSGKEEAVQSQPSTSKQTGSPVQSTSKKTGSPVPSTSTKETGNPVQSTSKRTGSPITSTSTKKRGSPVQSTSKKTGSPVPSTSSQKMGSPVYSTSKRTRSPVPSTSTKETENPIPSTSTNKTGSPVQSTSKRTESPVKVAIANQDKQTKDVEELNHDFNQVSDSANIQHVSILPQRDKVTENGQVSNKFRKDKIRSADVYDVSTLPKTQGELEIITPGKNGYEICTVT